MLNERVICLLEFSRKCYKIFSKGYLLAEFPKVEYPKITIRNNKAFNEPPKPNCENEIIIKGKLS